MAISPKFLLNWPNISQINVTEHHPEILICCLPDKGLCTVKNGGNRSHILILGTEICKIYKVKV